MNKLDRSIERRLANIERRDAAFKAALKRVVDAVGEDPRFFNWLVDAGIVDRYWEMLVDMEISIREMEGL